MMIEYSLLNKILFIILGVIFIVEGLDLIFAFGFNHHLYHLFWIVVSFYVGVIISKKWCV